MIRCTSLIRIIFVIFIAASLFQGCGKESKQKKIIARVNDSYLTKEDLARMMDTSSVSNFYKNEVIRNWINREVLYQQAEKQGIVKEDNFKRIMHEAQIELAGSLLLQKYYEDEKSSSYQPSEVEDFYNNHKDDFIRFHDSYLINLAVFNNEDKAIRFRTIALESNWDKAANIFKDEPSIIERDENELLYDYQIQPAALYRVVSEMDPNEISTIINEEPGKYAVVKLIDKFEQDAIPPYSAVKQSVLDEFIAQKKEELLNNYLKELYSNNKIEIRN